MQKECRNIAYQLTGNHESSLPFCCMFFHGSEKCFAKREFSENLNKTNCFTEKNIKGLPKAIKETTKNVVGEGLTVC